MSDHSIRGYLSRQSTEKLELILNDYLQEKHNEKDDAIILAILQILEARFVPSEPDEAYYRIKEKLLAYKSRTED